MNPTETLAYDWLLTNLNYEPENILYQNKDSPDFICSDGKGFEVKKANITNNSKSITFHKSQWDKLKEKQDQITILVYTSTTENQPILLSMKELKEREKISGIKILVYRSLNNTTTRPLTLPKKTWQILDEMTKKYAVISSQELIRRCIGAMIKGENKN